MKRPFTVCMRIHSTASKSYLFLYETFFELSPKKKSWLLSVKAIRIHPLSLLEITIGLALTTILLASLFSCFRHLTQTEAQIEKIEDQKHWEYVTQLRLNRIFENVPSHSVFSIEPYGDKIKEALHFTFNNGIDPDPQFCQVQEVYLGLTDQNSFCLYIEPKLGAARKEIFFKNVSHFKMEFFDPKEKLWSTQWDKDYLPPLVKISLSDREFFFVILHANRMVDYA